MKKKIRAILQRHQIECLEIHVFNLFSGYRTCQIGVNFIIGYFMMAHILYAPILVPDCVKELIKTV